MRVAALNCSNPSVPTVRSRADSHMGEAYRLVNMSYGLPMSPNVESSNIGLETAMRVYPALNGPYSAGTAEPLESTFEDAGHYPIVVTGQDGLDYRNSMRALRAATQSTDPYIKEQAKDAVRMLQRQLADSAQNLDVTNVFLNPGAFPLESPQQPGQPQSMGQAQPSLVQNALSDLRQQGTMLPLQRTPAQAQRAQQSNLVQQAMGTPYGASGFDMTAPSGGSSATSFDMSGGLPSTSYPMATQATYSPASGQALPSAGSDFSSYQPQFDYAGPSMDLSSPSYGASALAQGLPANALPSAASAYPQGNYMPAGQNLFANA